MRSAREKLVRALAIAGILVVPAAWADPQPPGVAQAQREGRPGASALGPGTIFLTRMALRAPESGTLYLSQGQALASLPEPVGSCRLRFRVPGGQIATGTPLTVEAVDSATSPYEDRGISSVTWRFAPGDPAESLFCDTVGRGGLAQGDVELEIQGILKLEAPQAE